MAVEFTSVKDSGDRSVVELTGSRRDRRPGKGLPHLVPTKPIRRLSAHFEHGAVKYGFRNWEKGQPLSWYWDSAWRHLHDVLDGKQDEDHPAAVLWNMCCFMETVRWIEEGKLPAELNDINYPIDVKKPEEKKLFDFYLSGPMTGMPDDNKPFFMEAAAYLRSQGFTVLNPAELDSDIKPDELKLWKWTNFLERDLVAMVGKSKAIVLLDGWEKSKGACLEYDVSHRLGREIWYVKKDAEGKWNHFKVN